MNQIFQPQKKDLLDLWNKVVEHGTKPQRRALRFFVPYFSERGVGPSGATTAVLAEIVNALPEAAAREYFKQPDKQNRYAANSFIRALADIEERAKLGLPTLDRLPALDAEERAAKAAFETRFAPDLENFFVTYRLPDVHCTDEMREKIEAKGGAVISAANRAGIINGLFNGYTILVAAGVEITRLADLSGPKALEVFTPAVKKDSPGRARQMCQTISQLAKAHRDYTSAKAFDQLAAQIVTDHDLDVIDGDIVLRLQPFADDRIFKAFGTALVAAAKVDDQVDLTKKVILIGVGSGLGALVSVSAPAAFEVIADCAFTGAIDPERERPTLFSRKHGPLEKALNGPMRDLIDKFYFAFASAFGFPPESLMPGKDGKLRKGGIESVNKLLVRVGAPFTACELRHLGVYRQALAGDTIAKMATAARLSERHFRHFYKPMLDAIQEQKS